MAKRKRDIQLKFRVTPQEREMIETKMAQFGTTNMAAYLRKMAIDGYVVKLDLPELRELVSLLRYSSNNLNQLTRRAHETGRIYEADLEDIQQSQERIWTAAEKIISSLAALSDPLTADDTVKDLIKIVRGYESDEETNVCGW